jgi:hypothetical protein
MRVSSDRMTEQFHKGKNRRKRSDVHGELHHGWPVCVPNQGMQYFSDDTTIRYEICTPAPPKL